MDKDKVKEYQKLNELLGDDDDEEDHIYYDVETKKHYKYDGTSFVEIPADSDYPESTEDEIADILSKEFEERDAIGEDDPEGVGDVDFDTIFDDDSINQIEMENTLAKMKERKTKKELEQRRKARQERRERGGRPLLKEVKDLKFDIEELIAKQVKDVFGTSWRKLNKTYNANTGDIIAPGRVKVPQNKIPTLQVYFDQSVSWDQRDIAIGMDVISVLDDFMEKNQLIVDVKYFAQDIHDDVSSARADARMYGNTYAGPAIVDDILATEPDNVLIMTDGDFDRQCPRIAPDFNKVANVPGGAWFLFKEGEQSSWIMKRVRGDEETKYYKF